MRKFAKATVFAAVVAAMGSSALAQDIVEGPEVTWNVSLWGNPRAFTQPAEDFSELLAERTGGKFEFKLFYGAQLSAPRENLDGLQIGAFEAAYYSSSFSPDRNPVAMGLDLPFLPVANLEARQRVVEAYQNSPEAQAEWSDLGVKWLHGVLVPQFEFMGAGEAPRTLEDWSGKRVRALAGLAEAMNSLGATSVSISPPEVYTSLERGVIDAASFPFSYAHGSYGLHEVSSWYTDNLNPGVNHAFIFASQAAWDDLPEQYKTLFMEVKDEVYRRNIEAMAAADEKWLPIFEEAGLTAISYSEEELERWREDVAKPLWDDWVVQQNDAGRDGQKLLDLILDTAAQ
ncbi:TRAP transporter substrate-binding protein DctP [Heliomarina baculiformis]|uniref:TRAP transporter substrate-binding protein DctP n=1 Tax=Heliomarina baculiformis TaxID=2872036 RepID=UPI001EE21FD5|nr:TRAP transporter substrate-binding protein DctP [Heliomarina baculiformis]